MSPNDQTFESVHQQIESASAELDELEKHAAGVAGAANVGAANVGDQACKAYKIVRPILNLVQNLPLIPGSWKKAIRVFMQLMDGFCPTS